MIGFYGLGVSRALRVRVSLVGDYKVAGLCFHRLLSLTVLHIGVFTYKASGIAVWGAGCRN